jgi:transcriptional regulator with XRE-family HTH domain
MTHYQPARALLQERRISIADAARRIGVSKTWLCRVLRGEHAPGPAVLDRLSLLLGVPPL